MLILLVLGALLELCSLLALGALLVLGTLLALGALLVLGTLLALGALLELGSPLTPYAFTCSSHSLCQTFKILYQHPFATPLQASIPITTTLPQFPQHSLRPGTPGFSSRLVQHGRSQTEHANGIRIYCNTSKRVDR